MRSAPPLTSAIPSGGTGCVSVRLVKGLVCRHLGTRSSRLPSRGTMSWGGGFFWISGKRPIFPHWMPNITFAVPSSMHVQSGVWGDSWQHRWRRLRSRWSWHHHHQLYAAGRRWRLSCCQWWHGHIRVACLLDMALWSTGSSRRPDGEVGRCCPRCQCHMRPLGEHRLLTAAWSTCNHRLRHRVLPFRQG